MTAPEPAGASCPPPSGRGGPGRGTLLAILLALAPWAGACGQEAAPPEAGQGAVPAPVHSLPPLSREAFASLVERLSEPGGYFDTDNLISNESSYLHVMGALRELGVSGGAYVGVGPDQNFSYIAEIRPAVAFILDLRRDNLLQQILFKALFELADSRAEYLALLLGRPLPGEEELPDPEEASLARVLALVDRPADPEEAERAVAAVRARVEGYGVPVSAEDLETIERFHRSFIAGGLGLRFRSHGRPPSPSYPSYRRLLEETDLEGRPASYMATEERWGFVQELQRANRVIPVVGDLAGSHAVRAIGEAMEEEGVRLSAFYASNVEYYLWGDGSFRRWLENLSGLPRTDRSVIIRSYFRGAGTLPQSRPGYNSTQLLQPVEELVELWGREEIRSYADLVTRGLLEEEAAGRR